MAAIADAAAAAGVEQAYAWLPLRSYGLRFLIQADWRVPSSREAIIESVFNQFPGPAPSQSGDRECESRQKLSVMVQPVQQT